MAILLQDSFTAANGTLLGSHAGEVNAVWASNTGFGSGNGNADEFIIKSNRLRRVDFTDPSGFDGGTALAYSSSSPSLDSLPHFDVTFDLTFEVGVTNSELQLWYEAQSGSATAIATINNVNASVAGGSTVAHSMTPGTASEIRLIRRGDILALFIDGAMIEAVAGFALTGKFGISMFDVSADTKMYIDNLNVASVETVEYYDEFNGSGTLASYTSDSGASYIAIDPLTTFTRTSGYLVPVGTADTRDAIADVEIGAGEVTVEFFPMRATSAGVGLWSVEVGVTDVGTPFKLGAQLRYLSGVTEIWAFNGDNTTTQDINELAGTPSPLVGVLNHMAVSYDAGTSEIVINLNGAEVHRATIPVLDTMGWSPYIALRASAASDTRLLRAMVSVASPAAPVAFWTNRILTQEVI